MPRQEMFIGRLSK